MDRRATASRLIVTVPSSSSKENFPSITFPVHDFQPVNYISLKDDHPTSENDAVAMFFNENFRISNGKSIQFEAVYDRWVLYFEKKVKTDNWPNWPIKDMQNFRQRAACILKAWKERDTQVRGTERIKWEANDFLYILQTKMYKNNWFNNIQLLDEESQQNLSFAENSDRRSVYNPVSADDDISTSPTQSQIRVSCTHNGAQTLHSRGGIHISHTRHSNTSGDIDGNNRDGTRDNNRNDTRDNTHRSSRDNNHVSTSIQPSARPSSFRSFIDEDKEISNSRSFKERQEYGKMSKRTRLDRDVYIPEKHRQKNDRQTHRSRSSDDRRNSSKDRDRSHQPTNSSSTKSQSVIVPNPFSSVHSTTHGN
jgi:hypothetical protein